MKESAEIEDLKNKLKSFADHQSRIDYLEKFLINDNENLNLPNLAAVYELLGDLYNGIGKPKGTYFQKAAATYETLSVISEKENKINRELLKKAYNDYQKAFKIFKKNQNFALMNDVDKRLGDVREQLVKEIGPMKKLTIVSVMLTFVVSFFLISSSYTGLVVSPLSEKDTTFSGFVLAILAIVGMFVASRWLLK